MDRLCTERHPGVWHNEELKNDGGKGRGLGGGGHGGWAEVHGRVEARRGRRDQTSPGEERGNETGKVAIAHGSVEFCEATPIGLAEESKESLYGCETDRDHLRNADLRSA